ncbi:IS21 family transposase (plasmid) [Priestia megaterium NCT-2]|uniref:IS21 family transposase n=1 Tax=Priestia megaterium TaxID=1404 RepID=UPI000344AEDC|nr:IS21 family transposase [Priestia megaterium]AYE53799.1 IS21 family transposase [Priestia megaterium NCT-2]
MLAMPEINYIKHLRENEDLSLSEIARKTGKDWRTVKKYADGDVPTGKIGYRKSGMMVEDGYGEIIDDWLEEDLKVKKKERRTNKVLFEQLQKEHGFPGSYRTVCEYIQHQRPQVKELKTKRYERLEHPPGEAQVDFGNMTIVQNGAYKDIKALILSFPYSNAAFAYPLPAENSECFLEGLTRLFHQAGGVPTHLRIDNLTAAVVSIGKSGKRIYTDAFLGFQSHYRFEIQACNPASGHEKGNVEKKVGYTRNNFFVTAPSMEDFEQLAEWLYKQMQKDQKRLHYDKKILIEELWKEDKKCLKVLPSQDLPIFSVSTYKVNKYDEIIVDEEAYVVHKARMKQSLLIKKEWDTFTCFTNDGEILYQESRPYMNKSRVIPWEDILDDWIRKPRSVTYSRHFKHLPTNVQWYLTRQKETLQERIIGLKKLLATHTMIEIGEVLSFTNRMDLSPHELGNILSEKAAYPVKMPEIYTPQVLVNYETDLRLYDQKLFPQAERSVSIK